MESFNMITAKEAKEISDSVDVAELLLKDIDNDILRTSKEGGNSTTYIFRSDTSDKIINKIVSKLKRNGYSINKSGIESVQKWYCISW